MDYRSAVMGRPLRATGTKANPLAIEQAIYTSIRTPLGTGYRIVSASSGLTTAEQQEINRRAPSHGMLSDDGEEATGFACFRLESGRHCMLDSCHAGLEQTARGGRRVHTHAFVFSDTLYERSGFNPFLVMEIGRQEVPANTISKPPKTLRAIDASPDQLAPRGIADVGSVEDAYPLLSLLARALEQEDHIVLNAAAPEALLRMLLAAMPAVLRNELSFSWGMRCSPERKFHLTFYDATPAECELYTNDHQVGIFDWTQPPAWSAESTYGPWVNYVQSELRLGSNGYRSLATALNMIEGSHTITLAARLAADMRGLDEATLEQAKRTLERYQSIQSENRVVRGLLDEVRGMAQERIDLLEPESDEATDAES